jgi:tRNA (cytidine/uridine-2'-O-)-methyltransferase
VRLALFEPDIPQNTGSLMRLAVCLGVGLDVIDPAGFLMSDRRLKRAGMDYIERLDWKRHRSWDDFLGAQTTQCRLLLLTTKGTLPYHRFMYRADDVLLLGRESAGVPEHVHQRADARLVIPMRAGLRSLNVALAAGMVLGEALRQTCGFPGDSRP